MDKNEIQVYRNPIQELAKITSSQFTIDYTVLKVNRICRKVDSIPEILKSDLPSLAQIKKRFDSDFVQAYIEGWIVNIREFINVGKKMTDEQTEETAMFIVDEYYNLNLADISYIFKNAKIGKYGKIYDRLDGQIILSWFEEHFSKRCSAAADASIMEAENYKDDPFQRTSGTIKIQNFIKQIEVNNEKKKFNNIL